MSKNMIRRQVNQQSFDAAGRMHEQPLLFQPVQQLYFKRRPGQNPFHPGVGWKRLTSGNMVMHRNRLTHLFLTAFAAAFFINCEAPIRAPRYACHESTHFRVYYLESEFTAYEAAAIAGKKSACWGTSTIRSIFHSTASSMPGFSLSPSEGHGRAISGPPASRGSMYCPTTGMKSSMWSPMRSWGDRGTNF